MHMVLLEMIPKHKPGPATQGLLALLKSLDSAYWQKRATEGFKQGSDYTTQFVFFLCLTLAVVEKGLDGWEQESR